MKLCFAYLEVICLLSLIGMLLELTCFYLGSGLEILAFPCNQFGAQEPGTNEQIVEFACTRFKAEFPIFDKVGHGLNFWDSRRNIIYTFSFF